MKRGLSALALTAVLSTGLMIAPPAHATEAVQTEAEWMDVNIGQPAINQEGIMYLPMRSTFTALGVELVWQPEGQTDKIKLKGATAGYQIFTKADDNGSYIGISKEGPWFETRMVNGQLFMPMAFLQELTNRTVYISGTTVGMIDYAPAYDNTGKNTNPLWKSVLSEYTYEAPPVVNTGATILRTAFQYQGVPYVWGGSTPAGFDCSGFTSYVYAQNGIGLPRTAAAQQSAATPVAMSDVQAGDLVFWGYPAYHVGIYIGDGQYIHAPAPGQTVSVGYVQWFPFSGAGRMAA